MSHRISHERSVAMCNGPFFGTCSNSTPVHSFCLTSPLQHHSELHCYLHRYPERARITFPQLLITRHGPDSRAWRARMALAAWTWCCQSQDNDFSKGVGYESGIATSQTLTSRVVILLRFIRTWVFESERSGVLRLATQKLTQGAPRKSFITYTSLASHSIYAPD